MENMFFALENLHQLSRVAIRCYNSDGTLCLYEKDKNDEELFHADNPIIGKLIRAASDTPELVMDNENHNIMFVCFRDENGNITIIGPVCTQTLDDMVIKNFCNRHSIKAKSYYIPLRSIGELQALSSLIYYSLIGKFPSKDLELHEIRSDEAREEREWAVHLQLMETQDNELIRIETNEEQEMFRPIREGNVEKMRSDLKKVFLTQRIPKLAKSQFKHYEYMVCSSITLATRAAIMGGLDTVVAFNISDSYLRNLETCKSIGELLLLHQDMMLAFTYKVHELKEKASSSNLIMKCKDYIEKNLCSPLTLQSIADALFVSKFHLSRSFMQSEQISISHYIIIRRLEFAKQTLRFSKTPIATIAFRLCFASQSHFTKHFKSYVGMTPLAYRNSFKNS